MKHLIYLVFLVLFCACQSSDDFLGNDVAPDGQTTSVTVDFTLPDGVQSRAASRAFGDGTTVDKVAYAAYKTGTTTLYLSGTADWPNSPSSLKLIIDKLPLGETLDFVFWAYNSTQTAYTFNANDATVTIDYTKIPCNDDRYDAFFNNTKNISITKGIRIDATLTRPFAQLNILTDDLSDADDAQYSVKLGADQTTIFKTLNLLDGSASGSVTPTYLAASANKDYKININGKDYTVLTMNYLLMGTTDEAHSVQLFRNDTPLLNNGNEYGITNVPFKRNFRTNIYGSLLTSSASVYCTIDEKFGNPDLVVSALIASESELKSVLTSTGSTGTFRLSSNIELTSPIAIDQPINVVLDLNGKDIKAAEGWDNANNAAMIHLNNAGANLIIQDTSTPDKELDYGNLGLGVADYVVGVSLGNLTVNGGDFLGKKGCIKWLNNNIDGGSSPRITINGGTFTALETTTDPVSSGDAENKTSKRVLDFALEVPKTVTWNINNVRNFIVMGGTFTDFDPSNCIVKGFSTWNFLPTEGLTQSMADGSNYVLASGYSVEYDSATNHYTVKYTKPTTTPAE